MNGLGIAGKTARAFIDSKLTPLLMVATLGIGVYATIVTPREDQPTIEVPRAMVFIPYPGAGAEAVDHRVARPAMAWISEIATVDEVTSEAQPDAAILTVTFQSGLSQATTYSQLSEQLLANAGSLPTAAGDPVIRMLGTEDVVAVAITLWSTRYSGYELRRIASSVAERIEEVPDVRGAEVLGGYTREIRIELDPSRLGDHRLSPVDVVQAVGATNITLPASVLQGPQGTMRVEAGTRIASAEALGDVVVGGPAGPVALRNLGRVVDGPSEATSYVSYGGEATGSRDASAVTIAVTNLRATNIGAVSQRVLNRVDSLQEELLPDEVHAEVVFDAGADANEQVKTLMKHLLLAIAIVLTIIALGLGLRGGLIVAVVIPLTLAIVPVFYFMGGITMNEISIAAMIFAIGILSDDAVVIIENIARYIEAKGKKTMALAVRAVDEVGNPTILATFTILAALLPTAFISGEMGQYTRPLPIGASAAMGFSLIVALTITPYLAYRFLPGQEPEDADEIDETEAEELTAEEDPEEEIPGRLYEFYRRLLTPFLERPTWRWALYGASVLALAGSISLVALRVVPVTLLLKTDSQSMVVVADLPQDATVEETVAAGMTLGSYMLDRDDVESYQLYAGTSGPLIFPGLPRAVPEPPPSRFELQVRLVPPSERNRQSYEIAQEWRHEIRDILEPYAAEFTVKESPTGPSRMAALVAEVYGPLYEGQIAYAQQEVEEAFVAEPGLADVDVVPEPGPPRLRLMVDYDQAALQGVSAAQLARAVRIAVAGERAGFADLPREPEPVPITVGLPRRERASVPDLRGLYLPGAQGAPVPLSDLARFIRDTTERSIHRKDMLPVVYVTGELAREGVEPIYAQLDVGSRLDDDPAPGGEPAEMRWFGAPDDSRDYVVSWAGEWQFTYQAYRDLGIAGLAVIALIYLLMVGWFKSFLDPLIIMSPIPLIFVGVIPAHLLMGISITGLGTIGVIALAGIVARNSILLVDFARERLAAGMDMKEAVIRAGAVRTRPVVLTALTVIFGDGVLILDPALKGLGLTLASGALVTTALTLLLIPIIYHHVHGDGEAETA